MEGRDDETPAAHTMAYFKDIVYRYDYERAVREGFLVDYDVGAVKSNVRMNGIFLNEGEQVEVGNPSPGPNNSTCWKTERQFDSAKIDHDITSPDTKGCESGTDKRRLHDLHEQ